METLAMEKLTPLINILLSLALAPLLIGVINRTKALFAGRKGQPILQLYYDLFKLLNKGAVYSRTTSWVFRAGPIVGLSSLLAAMTVMPFGSSPALFPFQGDLVLFAYLLGLARFLTVLAALDTGSAFEGMGSSREVLFSALAEPVLFIVLAALARFSANLSLTGMLSAIDLGAWTHAGPALTLVVAALLFVFLTENCRIPVDDPNTHLELTMIHEVMILDHSGPDLSFILYGAVLKLWILGTIIIRIVFPIHTGNPWLDFMAFFCGMLILSIAVGIVESSMARLRMLRVPQMLVGAAALAILALFLVLR
jgi:formate hydrogenlyase subunit 4